MVTTLGDVWVAVAATARLPHGPSNRVVQRIPVGASPSVLAASGGMVWVADGREPTLTRIDARTGEVLGTTTLRGHAGGLAVGFGAVWATLPTVGRLARLDPHTGRVLDEIPVGSGPGPIAVGGDGVGVANALVS